MVWPGYTAGPTATVNVLEAGMPVDTVSELDCVLSAGEAMVAVTVTGVCTVPELTTVCTVPSAADVAETGEKLRPPTVVFREKVTVTPAFGAPVESSTLKMTVEVDGCPVPFRPIMPGMADTNSRDPVAAEATVTVPVAVRLVLPIVALAVMTSEPLHPLAVYVASAVPVVVSTVLAVEPAEVLPEAATEASPCEIHVELNVIVTGAVV